MPPKLPDTQRKDKKEKIKKKDLIKIMTDNILLSKSKKFALFAIRFYQALQRE